MRRTSFGSGTFPRLSSKRAQRVRGLGRQLESVQNGEQLSLLVAEVVLHDRRDALEVAVQFRWGHGAVDGAAELGQQMGDHRVILFERAQHRAKLWVRGADSGEQGQIFTAVVAVEGCAETVAEQQQLAGSCLPGLAISEGLAGDA